MSNNDKNIPQNNSPMNNVVVYRAMGMGVMKETMEWSVEGTPKNSNKKNLLILRADHELGNIGGIEYKTSQHSALVLISNLSLMAVTAGIMTGNPGVIVLFLPLLIFLSRVAKKNSKILEIELPDDMDERKKNRLASELNLLLTNKDYAEHDRIIGENFNYDTSRIQNNANTPMTMKELKNLFITKENNGSTPNGSNTLEENNSTNQDALKIIEDMSKIAEFSKTSNKILQLTKAKSELSATDERSLETCAREYSEAGKLYLNSLNDNIGVESLKQSIMDLTKILDEMLEKIEERLVEKRAETVQVSKMFLTRRAEDAQNNEKAKYGTDGENIENLSKGKINLSKEVK